MEPCLAPGQLVLRPAPLLPLPSPLMNQPSPELLTLMAVAAQRRAAGHSWDTIGAEVQRAERTCRSWPQRYPEAWQRLYLEAEEHVLTEASVEAMHYLRKLLRTDNPWLQQNTAKFLYTQRCGTRMLLRDAAADAAPGGDWGPFLAYLETLTDAQVKAYLQEFLARRLPQASPALPAPAGDAGPPVGQ